MKHVWLYDRKRERAVCSRRIRGADGERRQCTATRVPGPVQPEKISTLFGPLFVDTAPCREKVSGGIAADNARR